MRKAKGNRVKAFEFGTARLLEQGVITGRDAKSLSQIIKILPLNARDPITEDTVAKVQIAYYELVSDPKASPTARAIVSGLIAALAADAPRRSVSKRSVSGTTVGTVVGAAVGGFVGGMFGGPLGGGVGAEIGAAVGGAIGSCGRRDP